MGEQPASEVSPAIRELVELLAERLDLAVGKARVELELKDGRLVSVWRHEKIDGDELARFDTLGSDA